MILLGYRSSPFMLKSCKSIYCNHQFKNRFVALYFPMKGLTRKNIKTVIIFSWILAYVPLLPSLFEIYGIHGLECQTRQCKILPIGSKGVPVKRYFEIVLHVFWAIVLVTANIGILIQYWVRASIKDNFFVLSTEKVVLGLD